MVHKHGHWTLTKSDEQKLEAFQMSCLRRILGLRWFDFVPNISVISQTQQRSICSRISDRRVLVFGHVWRTSPARVCTSAWSTSPGCQNPLWSPTWQQAGMERPRGHPRQTWIRLLETDVGFTADAAWDTASDRQLWRAQRPVAGQAVQWVSE